MSDFRKFFIWFGVFVLMMQIAAFQASNAFAYSSGDVVINEIAWAGSSDSANDEWIELYNTTNSEINLTGWSIHDDEGASVYAIQSGTIKPHSYFLIEDSEVAVSDITADAVIGLSLANAGDSLVLKDNSPIVIDTVNGGGGAWYAGNASSKATMERIDPASRIDSSDNWATAVSSNGALSRNGSEIFGTPGSVNGNYGGGGPEVFITPAESNAENGDQATLSFRVDGVVDLYAYGFEINYDSSVLDFISVEESDFLKLDGAQTAFIAALENGTEGKLIVGNARLSNPPTGIDGNGNLFEITFNIIGEDGSSSDIDFGGSSFLSSSVGNMPAVFSSAFIEVAPETSVDPVLNAGAGIGAERYSLSLNWTPGASGADSYIIKKQLPDGTFAVIGETEELAFIDNQDIVPDVFYSYQIISVKNGIGGVAVSANGADNRGIKGDFNRSDRVDGKDIELLARSFGSVYGDEEYDPLSDVNYDGLIDGSDLIDLGVNFGLTYL